MLHAFTYIHIPGFWNKKVLYVLTQISYTIQTQRLIETTNIIRANIQYHLYIPTGMCFLLSFRIPYKSTDEAFFPAHGPWVLPPRLGPMAFFRSNTRSYSRPGQFECPTFLDVFGFRGFLISWSKKVGSLIFEVDWSGWSNSFQIQFLVEILEIPAVLSRRWADGPTSDCKTSSSRCWDSKLPRRSESYTLQGTT